MSRRPAIGILAALLLIPQLVGASDVGCSRHGSDAQPAAAATETMAGHEHHDERSGENTVPSEDHPVPDCCPAMSTCSNGAIQVVDNDLTSWSWHNEEPTDFVTSARSRVESPDPPPPKA